MKKIIFILFIFFSLSCDSDRGWDCIKSSGKIVQQEFALTSFEKITVWDRVKLVVKQGDEQRVIVETGANLMRKITVSVENNRLEIRNNNRCNLVRDYGLTTVYVTSPNISEIRSSTGMGVESDGVLNFPALGLYSDDFDATEKQHTSGDFKIKLKVDKLDVVANGRSKFFLSGTADQAIFGLYAGDCRIYAEELIIQDLNLFHRSTGPMVVFPERSIKGKITGWGDVISKNRPPIVEVEELYRGRLIFE